MTMKEFSDAAGIDYPLVYRQMCDSGLRWKKPRKAEFELDEIKSAVIDGLKGKIKFHSMALEQLQEALKKAVEFKG